MIADTVAEWCEDGPVMLTDLLVRAIESSISYTRENHHTHRVASTGHPEYFNVPSMYPTRNERIPESAIAPAMAIFRDRYDYPPDRLWAVLSLYREDTT